MKYKGFVISPVYHIGSDFIVKSDGTIKDRKPTYKDIDYYQISDDDGDWVAENTINECKATIDAFIAKCKDIDSKFKL